MKFRILVLLNLLLVAAAVLPILASAIIAYVLFTGRSLEAASTRLEAVSSYLANNAAEQMDAAELLVEHAANLAVKHLDAAAESLRSAVSADEKIRFAFLLDSRGVSEAVFFSKEIKRKPENFVGIDMSSDPAVAQAMKSGKPAWSPSYLSTIDGSPVISLAVPAGHKTILAQIDLSVLRRLSDRLQSYPNTATAIIDSQGIVVYSTVKRMAQQRENLWYSSALQRALAGGQGAVQEKIEGVDSVVGYTWIPHTKWAILVWEPRSSVLARTLDTERLMTVMAVLAAGVASVLSFLAAKRLIRPLDRVIATTEKIAQGAPIEPPQNSRIHEIGRLAEAVYRLGLEIRDREAQLLESNQALQESEARYRRFLDTAQEAIWAFDADRRTSYVNPALCQLLGYSASEFLGQTSDRFIDPAELEEHRAMSEKRQRGESSDYQRTFIAKDGRKVYCHVLASPILDAHGNFAGSIATMTDVTARVQQEEERRQHEARVNELLERLQQQFDAMPIACFLLGTDGTLVDVNPAGEKLFGLRKAEAAGRRLPCWFEDASQQERFSAWLAESSFTGPALFTHRIEGRDVHCEWHKSVVPSASGEKLGTLAMAQDVSEKLEAERRIQRFNVELEQQVAKRTRELEESNRELESFSYSVSHDLRAPLRAIDGYASFLAEDYGGLLPDEAHGYIAGIRRNAQRMGDLIGDLLTLSRLGRQALNVEEIDITQLAHEVWRETSAIRDVGRFQQNGTAGFFVEDNGIGLDMEYAPKIFEVFQRAHAGKQYEGTGIGLAIVQRIIKRHQGDIWVSSEPGKGATFYFTLGM